MFDIVEKVLQSTYIFNDVTLALKPRIIKASRKLDIAVIWINIWDIQSSAKAKSLINKYFNIRRYIVTVWCYDVLEY